MVVTHFAVGEYAGRASVVDLVVRRPGLGLEQGLVLTLLAQVQSMYVRLVSGIHIFSLLSTGRNILDPFVQLVSLFLEMTHPFHSSSGLG